MKRWVLGAAILSLVGGCCFAPGTGAWGNLWVTNDPPGSKFAAYAGPAHPEGSVIVRECAVRNVADELPPNLTKLTGDYPTREEAERAGCSFVIGGVCKELRDGACLADCR